MIPSRAAPMIVATTVTMPGTSTVRAMTLGVSRLILEKAVDEVEGARRDGSGKRDGEGHERHDDSADRRAHDGDQIEQGDQQPEEQGIRNSECKRPRPRSRNRR